MIDIHCHLLFGVDDGAKTIDESVNIIRDLANQGVTDLILTPHYIKDSRYNCNKRENEKRLRLLKARLKKEEIPITLSLGNELYIDEELGELLLNKEISSLKDTKYVLIELPMSGEYEGYQDIFLDLQKKGYQVILAHPERYSSFQKDEQKVFELIEMGILFQCNLGSIMKQYGKSAYRLLKQLLKKDLVYCFGTDSHHQKKDPKFYAKAMKKIKKYVGAKRLGDLLVNHPKEILSFNRKRAK